MQYNLKSLGSQYSLSLLSGPSTYEMSLAIFRSTVKLVKKKCKKDFMICSRNWGSRIIKIINTLERWSIAIYLILHEAWFCLLYELVSSVISGRKNVRCVIVLRMAADLVENIKVATSRRCSFDVSGHKLSE